MSSEWDRIRRSGHVVQSASARSLVFQSTGNASVLQNTGVIAAVPELRSRRSMLRLRVLKKVHQGRPVMSNQHEVVIVRLA